MSDLEQRIEHLEDIIEEMQLEAHASRVAIAVLSTALNGSGHQNTKLGDIYLEGVAQHPIEFNEPASDGYHNKLNEKVAALLGTQK